MPRSGPLRALAGGACLMIMASAAAADDPSATTPFEEAAVSVVEDGRPVEFRYRLLRPQRLDADRRYPVILFLHGAGERGLDNALQLTYLPRWLAEPEERARRPCFVVAPQCRPDHAWVAIDWKTKQVPPLPPEPTADLAAAHAALEQVLAAEPVDPDRIYLTGLSMGGYGSWELAARHPDRFAAVLPVCGGGDPATAALLAPLAIWSFHGTADPVVPLEISRRMVEAVEAAGGRPICSELPGVGHDAWTPAYRDQAVLDWLFAQRRR